MVWQLLCIYLVWNTKSNNIWIITGAINPSIVGNPLYLCRIHLWRAQCIFINLLLFLIKIFTIWGQKERSITIHIGHLATAEGPAKEVNLRMGLGWYIISEAFSGPSTSSYPSSAPTSPVSPGPLVIWWQHSQPLSQGCSFIRQSSWFSHFRHFRHCPVRSPLPSFCSVFWFWQRVERLTEERMHSAPGLRTLSLVQLGWPLED